jgi:hypothetical protein
MKKIILTVIAGAISYCIAYPQPCLPDGITFTTQEEIDNFQTNYPGCTVIEGNVTIIDYEYMNTTNLNGLSVLTSIGGDVNISATTQLTNLIGLDNVTSIGGSLIFGNMDWSNQALTSLTGLEGLTSIGGNLNIGYNPALTSIEALHGLTFIGGGISFNDNLSLTSLTGLENLTSIPGSFSIHHTSIPDLTGLEGLSSIGGGLGITTSPVTSLTGLNNVSSIGGNVFIDENNALASLTGLDTLGSIAGDLTIGFYSGNSALTDISALENLVAGSINNLNISYNSSLSTCDVQSICDYLDSPTGTVEIHDNSPGCNSPEEVEEACLTEVEEITAQSGITIIPNPSNNKITISSPSLTGIAQLSIFNVNGEKVIEGQLTDNETQIDISALPRGIYFVRLQNEKMVEVGKMVKE